MIRFILRKRWNDIRWYYHYWCTAYYGRHLHRHKVEFEKHIVAMEKLTAELVAMIRREENLI